MFVDGQIVFVEFPARDLAHMRRFYGAAFGWGFPWAREDRDADYVAFRGTGAEGGFSCDQTHGPVEPLVVLYARDLEAARASVCAAGGEITRDIFASRGGLRFHFRDPGENEVAVWSDVVPESVVVSVRKPRPFFFGFGRKRAARAQPPPRHAAAPPPNPTVAPPSPAAAPPPRPTPERILLTLDGVVSRTKHEHMGRPRCARMAGSTM